MNDQSNGDRPATKQDIERVLESNKQDIERAIELVLHEMGRRFEEVDRRLEAMDRRMDRFGELLFGLQGQMAALTNQVGALTKWADRLDRDNNNTISTQAAQQRAIDELAARVSKLEGQRQ